MGVSTTASLLRITGILTGAKSSTLGVPWGPTRSSTARENPTYVVRDSMTPRTSPFTGKFTALALEDAPLASKLLLWPLELLSFFSLRLHLQLSVAVIPHSEGCMP